MIIEFYGTPGAGKTYLASQIIHAVTIDGKTAKNIVELGRSRIINKAINKVIRFAVEFLPQYVELKKQLLNVLRQYSKIKAKYNNEPIEGFVDNIVYYSFWYKHLKNKKGLYIFDEGIVHQYVNMMVNYDVPIALICETHKMIPYIPMVVYVSSNCETNLISIKDRNRHVCYIDELSGQTLINCVTDYHLSCEIIKSQMMPLTICREDDIVRNIQIVRKAIKI